MAYMIPIIVNKKNGRKSSPGAVIAGLILFLLFGIIILLFFNRSGIFRFNFKIIFWIGGFMIFFAIILAISAIVSTTSINKGTIKSRNGNNYKQRILFQELPTQTNPYKIPTYEKENKTVSEKKPVTEIINYCRYCGAKKDLDDKFCHMCGIKF